MCQALQRLACCKYPVSTVSICCVPVFVLAGMLSVASLYLSFFTTNFQAHPAIGFHAFASLSALLTAPLFTLLFQSVYVAWTIRSLNRGSKSAVDEDFFPLDADSSVPSITASPQPPRCKHFPLIQLILCVLALILPITAAILVRLASTDGGNHFRLDAGFGLSLVAHLLGLIASGWQYHATLVRESTARLRCVEVFTAAWVINCQIRACFHRLSASHGGLHLLRAAQLGLRIWHCHHHRQPDSMYRAARFR